MLLYADKVLLMSKIHWWALMCFQSPPKGETLIEENKDTSAASASEPSSQEATPEKGKNTVFKT